MSDEATRYQKRPDDAGAEHPYTAIASLLAAGSRVLDIGCGSGEVGAS